MRKPFDPRMLDNVLKVVSSPSDPAVTQVGKYRLDRELGRGAMGVVYEAEDTTLKRKVAVKILGEGVTLGEAARKRFQREAQATGAISHPNVVALFDAGEDGGRMYLVMEFVDGASFDTVLKKQPRDIATLIDVIEQVARGVSAAHAQGVVHRDLKPSNIMITAGGVPKVADFGLAHWVQSDMALTQPGAQIGTPLYMAPEQVRSDLAAISPATDVYALGAILYEAISGKPPYVSNNLPELYVRIINGDLKSPRSWNPQVTRELESVCLKALDRNPERRYLNAGAFADDLHRYLDGEPVRARRLTAFGKIANKAARHRKLIIALTLLMCLGMGLVIIPTLLAERRARILEEATLAEGERSLRELEEILAGRTWTMDKVKALAERAKSSLNRVTRTVENRRRALLGIVRILVLMDDNAQAEEYCTTAIVMKNTDVPSAAYLERARVRFHMFQVDDYGIEILGSDQRWTTIRKKIHEDLAEARKLPNADQDLIQAYSSALSSIPLEAARHFQTAAEKRIKDWRLWEDAGRAWYEAHCWKESISALDKALELRPRNPNLLLLRGNSRGFTPDTQGATEDVADALASDPGCVRAYIRRAGIHLGVGRYQEAIEDLKKVLAFKPDHAWAVAVIARAYQLQGNLAAADEFANQAIRMDPGLANAYIVRGTIRNIRGEFDQADLDFLAAIARDPRCGWAITSRADLHRDKGTSLLEQGQKERASVEWELAIENYTLALAVESPNARALLQRGGLFLLRSEIDRAILDFSTVLEMIPNEPEALWRRGNAFIDKGEFEPARRDLQELIKCFPGSHWEQKAEATLRRLTGKR